MCVMKPTFDYCIKHKYGFVNPHLVFKTHMCVMKPTFDSYTKHKYGFVNPNSKTTFGFWKAKFGFWNPHTGFDFNYQNPHYVKAVGETKIR
jgi:hypothetical protein